MSLLRCAVICFIFMTAVEGSLQQMEEKEILSKIFENYDIRIKPTGLNNTGPIIVKVNMYVRSISNIDDVNMVYDVQLNLRQRWVDDRLSYSNQYVEHIVLNDPALLWTPDIYFDNEESGRFHNMLSPYAHIKVYPSGNIQYSARISLRLSCPMDLKSYPFDTPVCNIFAQSYGYYTEDLVFLWENPVTVNKNLQLSRFRLSSFSSENYTIHQGSGIIRDVSCLKVEFMFSRYLCFYIERVYFPITFLFILSWMAFWVNPKQPTLRFGIPLSVLICCHLLTTSINTREPQVPCVTAMDDWILFCTSFVYYEIFLMFYILVLVEYPDNFSPFKKENAERYKRKRNCSSDIISNSSLQESDDDGNQLSKNYITALKINEVAKIAFPLLFILYTTMFWFYHFMSKAK